jgi:hypothetical protein
VVGRLRALVVAIGRLLRRLAGLLRRS